METTTNDACHTCDAAQYQQNAAFVPPLGAIILEWLRAQAGEEILDLGAADGALTLELV